MNKQEKNELIDLISKTDDDILLNQIRAILEGTQIVLWDELNPALKLSIQRGLDQSIRNDVKPHSEVIAHLRKQFK